MIVCIPINPDGTVDHRWGKAHSVALAAVDGGAIRTWTVNEVEWDRLHDEGTEGSHHARVVRFLREHDVTDVLAGHMGGGMQTTLGKLGVRVRLGAAGDARAAVESLAASSEDQPS
jgi:predicted Fe-Mo cluster-binding NifX family protein